MESVVAGALLIPVGPYTCRSGFGRNEALRDNPEARRE